jgi:hypothetical protein
MTKRVDLDFMDYVKAYYEPLRFGGEPDHRRVEDLRMRC